MAAYYDDYFTNQYGGSRYKIFVGRRIQRGHGVGSFFGGLFRTILPILKNNGKFIGKEVARNVISDIVEQNIPVKEANNLKRRAREKIDHLMSGNGYYKGAKMSKLRQSRRKRPKRRINKTAKKKGVKKGRVTRRAAIRRTRKKRQVKKRTVEDIFS